MGLIFSTVSHGRNFVTDPREPLVPEVRDSAIGKESLAPGMRRAGPHQPSRLRTITGITRSVRVW
jgi:hypothetical protein